MLRSHARLVLFAASLSALGCDAEAQEALAAKQAEVTELQKELDSKSALSEQHEAAIAELKAEQEAHVATQEKATKLAAKVEDLESKAGSLEGELKKKDKALAAVKALQETLSKSLVEEIETGDIRVSERHGYLVVDVSDKVLFATGEATLSERGKKLLGRLAESLLTLPKDSVFQVGGHTDNQPIKSEEVLANFPTNWELSASRATNVVRFLEEECSVPGARLVAAGFSEFRPVSSNKKAKGRAKNRRIEIALLPPGR
ncbi:putative chemotaxis MotB protein [Plesiocystis pacifica SIR-1]|uniref:Putative chemotaxis MotB protein n=1 Tax=Plesiocystis pacifica SIR-1 TaxID=391625 RepID=A6G1Z8_9BACT|nr:OmpA family protein [Plesiocystis pacifica]EDM80188.1 putative chemotaxis MotB protein [Plesiocystis pacifica SIR-1]